MSYCDQIKLYEIQIESKITNHYDDIIYIFDFFCVEDLYEFYTRYSIRFQYGFSNKDLENDRIVRYI